MGSRVELFEQIRREREREGLSLRALAAKYGVHRRTVRQALESAVPPPRKRPVGRPAPALGPYRPLIDSWLEADRRVPRKQRHTARRSGPAAGCHRPAHPRPDRLRPALRPGGRTMTRITEDPGARSADRGARDRAQAPDRQAPLPGTR